MKVQLKEHVWIGLIHLLFWMTILCLMVLIYSQLVMDVEQIILATTVNFLGLMILIYAHLFYLMPRFWDQKKYRTYVVGILILIVITSSLRFFIGWSIAYNMELEFESAFKPSLFGSIIFTSAFFLLLSIPLRSIDNYFKKNKLENDLKTYQLEAELRFLKAQVNPHFLFNALNNIYALSFTESKKAPEMILKLSDMMSYMLYDCKSEEVKLSAEIDYLKNYIDLQQLKKDGEFNITFQIEGDPAPIRITPMLFIPFFENAFKHSNLDDTQNGWVNSTMTIRPDSLKFSIANTIKEHYHKAKKGGVGLENIRERLRLLFPNRHQLDISIKDGVFIVNLALNFSAS